MIEPNYGGLGSSTSQEPPFCGSFTISQLREGGGEEALCPLAMYRRFSADYIQDRHGRLVDNL